MNTHSCDDNAHCLDTNGSFTCSCFRGFKGNGSIRQCEGINSNARLHSLDSDPI